MKPRLTYRSRTITGKIIHQYSIILGIVLLLSAPLLTVSQTDTEFWFIAPEVSKNGGQNFDIPVYLRISTYNQASTVTISQPANPSFVPVIADIPANGFSTVDLSPFLDMIENKPANTVLNYGIHITATNPVSVYYEVASTYCNCNPEIFALKGKNSVGMNFIIPTQNYFPNWNIYSPPPYNAFDIVSTQDNNIVSITPSKEIVGHAAGVTFTVTLDKGQTWSALATSMEAEDHLWGSVVTSTKPVSITMTDDLLYGITGCADLIGDQIVPVEITGTDYIAVRGNLTNNGNRAFIIATQDNTDIHIDGNTVPVATLATGQLYNNNILNPSTFISATHPVYVFQTSGFGCELGGALLPSINCTGSTQIAFTRTTNQSLGLVIATQTGNAGSFLVNGDPSLITASDFLQVPGTGGNWMAASLTFSLEQIPVGTIVFVNNTTGPFHLGLMIGNPGGGCSYGYFSDFARLNLGPDLTICPDDSIDLHAGTGWNSYLWNTGATTEFIRIKDSGNYMVTVTDPSCILSDTMHLSLFPEPTVDLGPDHSLCDNLTDSLFTTGGPFAQYLWNTGATTPYLIINGPGTYTLTVTDINGCKATDTVHITGGPNPLVTNLPLSKTICTGDSTYIILTSNQPSTDFSWTTFPSSLLVTGFSDGNGTLINDTLYSTSANPETVTYSITPNNNGCIGPVADYIVTINPSLPVSVFVTASDISVCSGDPVTFTAIPSNAGTTPVYQWKVNGINTGINNPVHVYAPNNGDIVTCTLTSSEPCTSGNPAYSNPVTINVDPVLLVGISISASINPVCSGIPVVFTATPVNGGMNPIYQWKVNGINSGTNSAAYTYTPGNNDIVTCTLTSSETCVSGNPANSNPVTITVDPVLLVGVSISASINPVCSGIPVVFTATPVNGGMNPIYQWKVNGINSGTNSAAYTYTPGNNDIVTCTLTSSETCVSGNPASGLPLSMNVNEVPEVTFTRCFDTVTTINAKPFRLKGGTPLGGTYSGPGVNSVTDVFSPSTAGLGTQTITYSYTNVSSCTDSKTKTIIVHHAPAFTCGNALMDIRDNKIYPTVQIGSQCWMASNLDHGTEISENIYQTDNCLTEKYVYPSSVIHHSIYQWDELMNYDPTPGIQGLCPPEWHVPTETEWDILFNFYQGNSLAGIPLMDSYINGFSASPDGVIYLNSTWNFVDFATLFWSSTPSGPDRAISHGMNIYNHSVSLYQASRADAFPIRCIRDN